MGAIRGRSLRALLAGSLVLGCVAAGSVALDSQPAAAATPVPLYVASGGSGDCTTSATACGSIESAITTAESGSYNGDDVTINVAAGTYTENDTIAASGLNSLTLQGAGASTTTLSGGGTGTILNIDSGTVDIGGIAFADGNGTAGGLNVCYDSTGCTVQVTDSTFYDNSGNFGGAILNGGGAGNASLTVTDSLFSDNYSLRGGAINNGELGANEPNGPHSATLSIVGSTFTGNTSNYAGGAIDSGDDSWYCTPNCSDSVSVTNSTFSTNSTVGTGGALANGIGTLTVTASTFTGNVSSETSGGAISNGDNSYDGGGGATGTLSVSDSTFSGNSAPLNGGAIDNGTTFQNLGSPGDGVATVVSSTFSGNSASSGGGSISNESGSGSLSFGSSILADATSGQECSGTVTDEGYNIADDSSCELSNTGSVTSSGTLDASLGSLAYNGGSTETILPTPTSPVIGAVPNPTSIDGVQVCPATDQRGVASLADGPCDIGAVQDGTAGIPTVLHTTSASGANVSVGNVLTGVGGTTSNVGVACTSLATRATVESDPNAPGTANLSVTNATFTSCSGPFGSLTVTELSYPIAETVSDAPGDPVTSGPQTVDVASTAQGFDCQYYGAGGSGSWSNATNTASISGESFVLVGGTGNTNLCPSSTVTTFSLPATVDSSVHGHPAVFVASVPSSPTITNLPAPAYPGGSFTPVVSTTGDGVTSVTSSTPLACTVNPTTGVVSFLIAGSCTLTVHVAAGTNYGAADGTPQTFAISPNSPTAPTISNLPSSGAADTGFTATVSTSGDGTASVTSSTPAVCTATGLAVSFVEPGTCTLVAHVTAGASYGAADGSPQSVDVSVTVSSVVFTGTAANPTVTVYGSGFGPESGLGAPVSSGGTGYDYGSNLTFADTEGGGWTAGASPGPGFVISSYSNTQITFAFDSLYSTVAGAKGGDAFTLSLFGVSSSGTVAYPPAGQTGPGPFAFVAGSAAPSRTSLTPIDTSSDTAEPSFSGGTDPVAVAISPNGSTAYVVDQTPANSVSEISTSTDAVIGTPISTGAGSAPDNIAISPDGTTGYVTDYGTSLVTVFSTADPTGPTSTIEVGSEPDDVAITPDGTTGYVTSIGSDTVTVFSTADPTGATTSIDVGAPTAAVAISPDGSTAYVTTSDGTVIPIPTNTNVPDPTPISVGAGPVGIAITPDGSTAYVADSADGTVTPIALTPGGGTAGTPIHVGGTPFGVAVAPNGSTVYVTDASDHAVIPIATASGTPGTPIQVGATPYSLAIAPDQGPTASLQATTADGVTTFDASASGTGTSPIASYTWNFGDGSPEVVTYSATTSYAYATSGTYSASVTVTDAAGASTTEVYTGHTASLKGGPGATATASVQIQITACSTGSSCSSGPVAVAATPTTPAQTVTVTAPAAASGAAQALTVSNGPGVLTCGTKGFQEVGNITTFSANFQPTGNVTLTDAIPTASSPKNVKVCFQGATGAPVYLKKCNPKLSVLPCASVTAASGGGVDVTLVDSATDPRAHIVDALGVIAETPTSIGTKATVGKVFTIKGTTLLGSGQTYPTVDFTSCDGTLDATAPVEVSASKTTAVSVLVPNNAKTGTVQLVWSNPQTSTAPPNTETAISISPVAITGSHC